MKQRFDLALYVITDRSWLNGAKLEDQVQEAILGGATMVQLREKIAGTGEFIKIAQAIKGITDKYGIPLIINDRLDVMLAVDAAGLHIGQSDMPVSIARSLLGPEKILGVSVTNQTEAVQAVDEGADYLGAGAVFPTETKTDAEYVDFAKLQQIVNIASVPVVAIGGINESNLIQLKNSGIKGIAVVSAIFSKPDIRLASAMMKNLVDELLNK